MEPVGIAFAALGTADLCLKSVASRLFSKWIHIIRVHISFALHKSMTYEHVPNRLYSIMIGNNNVRVSADTEQIRK